MHRVAVILNRWLPLAAVAVILCGLIYVVAQQSLRLGANDPQIQMAEDAADALTHNATLDQVMPAGMVDVGRSLAPFMIVYNDQGQVLAPSGVLHGATPPLPRGVLDYARQHGQNRLTWEPEPGVRIAAVVVRVEGRAGGFVLAGRSLREVEIRESQLELLVGVALVAVLAISLAVVVASGMFFPEGGSTPQA